ncbi:MAG TPA: twin-arginine translocation signal domain-containing protein [Azospirillaceae bacterium]|nr:twin-arginine translocation signal domain-containing protein [Azospirillaceae bacterium]
MSGRDEDNPAPGRRDFLRGAGLAGAAAAAVLPAVLAGGEAEAKESEPEQVKARYRVTPHIERFYFLNSL